MTNNTQGCIENNDKKDNEGWGGGCPKKAGCDP